MLPKVVSVLSILPSLLPNLMGTRNVEVVLGMMVVVKETF
jgi:hypothetical protein